VREAEAVIGDEGSEVRLRRLQWEYERFCRRRQQRRLELSSDPLEEPDHPGEVRASNPPTREPPIERRDEAAARPPAPPDSFRDAVVPQEAEERELAKELAELESLIPTPLSESARVSLDRSLLYARDMAARVQVLRRWFAGMQHAYAMSEAAIGHLRDRAELRSAAPPLGSERHVIWREPWRADE
jgi:hypothetical protein